MKKKEKPGAQFRTVENKRLISALYILLRISVVMVLIAQVLNGNFENVMLCVLTLILFAALPYRAPAEDRPARHAGNRYSAVYLFRRNSRRDSGILCHFPVLGHRSAHLERLFVRGDRLFADRPFKPKQKIYVFPLSALRGGGVLLFFHDRRRTVGVF